MTPSIFLVDYGVGNLKSVARAFEKMGAKVEWGTQPQQILRADRVDLPGVGAFGHCMQELKEQGWIEPLQEFLQTERPFLGICVGMQMLLERGFEFGEHQGLGVIDGDVAAIQLPTSDNSNYRLPHIGWNQVVKARELTKNSPIHAIRENDYFYFIHSFCAQPRRNENLLAYTEYAEQKIPAVIGQGNVLGCQFHPEKSGVAGLEFIREFLNF